MQKIHSFHKQLAYSQGASHEPFWDAVYRKAFPDMIGSILCTGDNAGQFRGIDRVVQLSSGKTILIDEKKRRENWPDFALEYLSNTTQHTPGWMEKDLIIDYLAYAFMPSKKCYLFPWPLLRLAWKENGAEWKRKYRNIEAHNNGYKTLSVCVPIEILLGMLTATMLIKLVEDDSEEEIRDVSEGSGCTKKQELYRAQRAFEYKNPPLL